MILQSGLFLPRASTGIMRLASMVRTCKLLKQSDVSCLELELWKPLDVRIAILMPRDVGKVNSNKYSITSVQEEYYTWSGNNVFYN